MSDKEILDFTERLQYGLELAELRMLKEKALRGQSIIICSENGEIKQISAKKAMKVFAD